MAVSELPRRRDAQRNREAILAAARELLAASNEVPMYEIARRAGVGQATLYRNFPDHRDLVAALLDEHIAGLEQIAARHAGDPDAFFVLLRAAAESAPYVYALAQLAQSDAGLSRSLERCRERLQDLLGEPLCRAKTAGRLRRDLSVDDFLTTLAMIRGAVARAQGAAARATAASRALALLMDGLVPPTAR